MLLLAGVRDVVEAADAWIQQSAAWPSLCDLGSVSVPPCSSTYVVIELAPASPTDESLVLRRT